MTIKRYLNNKSLAGSAQITFIGKDEHGSYICLSATDFHAQGGGQPSDRGYINNIRVVKAIKVGDDVYHYVADTGALQVDDVVHLLVDCEWRLLCSKLHSAGHLISSVVEDRYGGAKARGGHHWPGEARVEFVGLPADAVEDLAARISLDLENAIDSQLPVEVCFDQVGARSIQIGDFAGMGCGGTHVENTGELNGVKILKVKRKGEIVRISYDVSPEPTNATLTTSLPDVAKRFFQDGTASYLTWNNA